MKRQNKIFLIRGAKKGITCCTFSQGWSSVCSAFHLQRNSYPFSVVEYLAALRCISKSSNPKSWGRHFWSIVKEIFVLYITWVLTCGSWQKLSISAKICKCPLCKQLPCADFIKSSKMIVSLNMLRCASQCDLRLLVKTMVFYGQSWAK